MQSKDNFLSWKGGRGNVNGSAFFMHPVAWDRYRDGIDVLCPLAKLSNYEFLGKGWDPNSIGAVSWRYGPVVWEGAQSARPVSKSQGDGMTWVLSAAGSLSLNMKEVAQRINQHGAAHVPGLPRAEGPGK